MSSKKIAPLSREQIVKLSVLGDFWRIKECAVSTMASAGVDLTTQTGVSFLDATAAATSAYNQAIYDLGQWAKETYDYNPLTDGDLRHYIKRGVVEWTPGSTAETSATETIPDDSYTEPAAGGENGR